MTYGIFDLISQSFVTKFRSHSNEYTNKTIHSDSKEEIESWLVIPGYYNGNQCEIREIPNGTEE